MDDKVIQGFCWPNTCCGSILNHPCQSTHGKTQRLNQQSSQLQSRGLTWQVFCFIGCSLFDLPLLRPWMWCRHHTWNVGEVRLGSLELLSRVQCTLDANANCGCVSPSMASYSGVLRLWLFDTVWLFGVLEVTDDESLLPSNYEGFTADLHPASTELSMANGNSRNSVSGVSCGRERHFGHPGILRPVDWRFCDMKPERGASHKKMCLHLWHFVTGPDTSICFESRGGCGNLWFLWILWTLRFPMWTWEADSPANALTPSRQVPANLEELEELSDGLVMGSYGCVWK